MAAAANACAAPRTELIVACYVYVLGTEGARNPRTYVGWTTDLDDRLARHNAGKGAKSTRGRAWILLYAERYQTRTDAMSREWHLKRDRDFRKTLRLSGS
ncbi:MAG: GIY-YIG nuclease family protein [Candidatus Binataceae bacterium]|jgi:putative endonuclease